MHLPAHVKLLSCAWFVGLAVACGGGGEPASPPPGPREPYARPEYQALSETGLYADLASGELAGGVRPFAPSFVLWSDGAEKQRWIELPPGAQIDTSDMNRWSFPIGTRVWKQFALNGVALETRLIERYGTKSDEYWMGSFVWNEEQSDAVFVEAGREDVLGTPHDAPPQDKCGACHNGEPGRYIGFSALQLDGDAARAAADENDGWSLPRLVEAQQLTAPPAAESQYLPPGDPVTAAALGYLHANCGHCHNPRGTSWPDTQMVLRLDVDGGSPEETRLYGSVVGKMLQYYRAEAGTLRVVPQDPEASALIQRMQVRGPKEQMPPLATEEVDSEGIAKVKEWIASLAE